jgi:hypothetical protein
MSAGKCTKSDFFLATPLFTAVILLALLILL